MRRPYINLQPSEATITRCAAQIYSAYIVAGKVDAGKEKDWMERAIQEAIHIAERTDSLVRSDTEMG